MDLFRILLFLHVLGAIVAFGPGFVSMVVGPMVAKEPQHANFYARSQQLAAQRVITPVSISMAVTGLLMIGVRGWTTIVGGELWLTVSIALYVVAVVISIAVMAPAGRRLVELTSQPPAPGSPPSPELPATARRIRLTGMTLSGLVVVIAFLMVTKPF